MASNRRYGFPYLRFLLAIVIVSTIFVSSPSLLKASTQVNLAWDANSEPNLAGYRVYTRQTSQQYNYSYPAYDGSETFCTIHNLEDTVENCFVVRAYDSDGNESGDSNEVCLPSATLSSDDVDNDSDGYTENQGDCDDADTGIHPDAVDLCGDGIDQNCDGSDLACVDIKADEGPDQTVAVNAEVTLNGYNSTSSDDDALSYEWKQIEGDAVQLSDTLAAAPTFQASVTEQALVFDLTVTDAKGLTSTDSCIVNVSEQNEPPTSLAGSDMLVASSQTVRLDGSGSMDDGENLSYSWIQMEGPTVALLDPTSPTPEFTSPTEVGPEGTSLTFQLTVTDQGGLKDTDSCIVNVTSQNQPPEAVTNEYVEAAPGKVVALDGTLSYDTDDEIESYRWSQLEGTPVTLDNPKAAQVKFSAPTASPYGSNLLFELKVKDGGGLKKSAKCAVFVQEMNNEIMPYTVTPTLSFFQRGKSYQARASVIVIDERGKAVKNAKVKGQWSLPGSNAEITVVGYTIGAGEAKWDSDRFVDAGYVSFTVTEISKDGISYVVKMETNLIVK